MLHNGNCQAVLYPPKAINMGVSRVIIISTTASFDSADILVGAAAAGVEDDTEDGTTDC